MEPEYVGGRQYAPIKSSKQIYNDIHTAKYENPYRIIQNQDQRQIPQYYDKYDDYDDFEIEEPQKKRGRPPLSTAQKAAKLTKKQEAIKKTVDKLSNTVEEGIKPEKTTDEIVDEIKATARDLALANGMSNETENELKKLITKEKAKFRSVTNKGSTQIKKSGLKRKDPKKQIAEKIYKHKQARKKQLKILILQHTLKAFKEFNECIKQ